MAVSPKGLWFAIITTLAFVAPDAAASGWSRAGKRLKVKYSDSFGGGKGGDFSDYRSGNKAGQRSATEDKAGQLPEQESGLLHQSSFPVRLLVGDVEQAASGQAPMTAQDPGGVHHRYKIEGCVLSIKTGPVALTVFGKDENGEFQVTNDAVYANSAFPLEVNQKFVVAAAAEVAVEVLPSTHSKYLRNFAGKRVFLGDIAFRDVAVFAVNSKKHVHGSVVDDPVSQGVWLEWTDSGRPPRLETDSGYAVMVETGRHSLALETGEYYIGMRLPWRLHLKPRP